MLQLLMYIDKDNKYFLNISVLHFFAINIKCSYTKVLQLFTVILRMKNIEYDIIYKYA